MGTFEKGECTFGSTSPVDAVPFGERHVNVEWGRQTSVEVEESRHRNIVPEVANRPYATRAIEKGNISRRRGEVETVQPFKIPPQAVLTHVYATENVVKIVPPVHVSPEVAQIHEEETELSEAELREVEDMAMRDMLAWAERTEKTAITTSHYVAMLVDGETPRRGKKRNAPFVTEVKSKKTKVEEVEDQDECPATEKKAGKRSNPKDVAHTPLRRSSRTAAS